MQDTSRWPPGTGSSSFVLQFQTDTGKNSSNKLQKDLISYFLVVRVGTQEKLCVGLWFADDSLRLMEGAYSAGQRQSEV